MGLFHRKKEEACDGAKILEQYDKGELDATSFIRKFGKAKVFYSTPFGDHVDGSRKLFILPGPDGTGYNPVFSSEEHLHEFYEKAGRAAYTIIEGTFSSFLDVVKKTNDGGAPVKMGVVIDPGYSAVTIDLPFLNKAILISKE